MHRKEAYIGNTLIRSLIDNSGGWLNRSKNTIAQKRHLSSPWQNIIDNRDSGLNQATNVIYSQGREIHNYNYITNVYQLPRLPYCPPLLPPPNYFPVWCCSPSCFPFFCGGFLLPFFFGLGFPYMW